MRSASASNSTEWMLVFARADSSRSVPASITTFPVGAASLRSPPGAAMVADPVAASYLTTISPRGSRTTSVSPSTVALAPKGVAMRGSPGSFDMTRSAAWFLIMVHPPGLKSSALARSGSVLRTPCKLAPDKMVDARLVRCRFARSRLAFWKEARSAIAWDRSAKDRSVMSNFELRTSACTHKVLESVAPRTEA